MTWNFLKDYIQDYLQENLIILKNFKINFKNFAKKNFQNYEKNKNFYKIFNNVFKNLIKIKLTKSLKMWKDFLLLKIFWYFDKIFRKFRKHLENSNYILNICAECTNRLGTLFAACNSAQLFMNFEGDFAK